MEVDSFFLLKFIMLKKYLTEVRERFPTLQKQNKLKKFLLSMEPGKVYQAIEIDRTFSDFLVECMHSRMHQSSKSGRVTRFDVLSYYLNVKAVMLRNYLRNKGK